jgi:hypothetical protein
MGTRARVASETSGQRHSAVMTSFAKGIAELARSKPKRASDNGPAADETRPRSGIFGPRPRISWHDATKFRAEDPVLPSVFTPVLACRCP